MNILTAIRLWSKINELQDKLKEAKPMSPKTINIITNVLGFCLVVFEPIKSYLTTQPFSWNTFLTTTGTAIVAWFTGKSAIHLQKINGGAK